MTKKERKMIDSMMQERKLTETEAMILLVLANDPRAQPGGPGMTEQEICDALNDRFSEEDLEQANANSPEYVN